MSTLTLSSADAILKDLYVGPIIEQLNYKTYLLDQIERDSQHIDHTGRRAVIPVHTTANRGRGARGDGGTLPTAGAENWQDAIVNIRYNWGAIELTDGSIRASESNEGAFISTLEASTKGMVNFLRKDLNRQAFGTGDGVLANVTVTATTQSTITLDSVQYIAVGDPVDILVKSSGAAAAGGGTANSVTARVGGTTKTITLASSVTVDATYAVYVSGSRNNEFDGLQNIISTSRTLHSINSATAGNEFWNSSVRNAGSSTSATAVAGETLFEQLADDVGFSGQGEVEVFLTTRGVKRRLADTYQSQKRFNDAQAVNVHGGYSAIMVNEVPVVADDDAPRGLGATNGSALGFGLNRESFRWFEQGPPDWLSGPQGASVFHLKDGSTAGTKQAVWQAFYGWYSALGCVAPNRNAKFQYATDDLPS